MAHEIYKLRIETPDGKVKEYEGEGIVAIAVTDNEEECRAGGGVIGKFNAHCIEAVIGILKNCFGRRWLEANIMMNLGELLGGKDDSVKIARDDFDNAAEAEHEKEE